MRVDIVAHRHRSTILERQVVTRVGEQNAWNWAAHAGAELGLLVQLDGRRLGFECKHADAPALTKSMHIARQDLKLERLVVVTPGSQSYPLADWAEVVGIRDLRPRLNQLLAASPP